MKKTFKFVVLAVTKTFDSYCIAGMAEGGKWVRPLPVGDKKFWSSIHYPNRKLIKVGDVWEITEYSEERDLISPGHTEDIRLVKKPNFIKHLTNRDLVNFVQRFQETENDLQNTMNAESRSLCLVKVDQFSSFLYKDNYNGRKRPRITFSIKGNEYKNETSVPGYPITDLKWREYTRKDEPVSDDWNSVFICIGLARKEPIKNIDKEYPMIISVITDPEVPLLIGYPY